MKRLLAAALLIVLCFSARSDSEILAYTAVAADVGTTLHALNQGEEEGNPIYGSRPSDGLILIGGAARALGVYMIANSGSPYRDVILDVISCVTFSIAGNNLAVAEDFDRVGGVMIGLSIPIFAMGMRR